VLSGIVKVKESMVGFESRVAEALGTKEVPELSRRYLRRYRKYLLNHLDKNCVLTGREDFLWEEIYVFGPGDKAEYARLKKIRPSYTDEYKLLDIISDKTVENDLIARIKRLSDQKIFEIGLLWLTTEDEKCAEFQILDDFASWVVNWF
jgi:hypothetical protein